MAFRAMRQLYHLIYDRCHVSKRARNIDVLDKPSSSGGGGGRPFIYFYYHYAQLLSSD